jgi:hypothetical protein
MGMMPVLLLGVHRSAGQRPASRPVLGRRLNVVPLPGWILPGWMLAPDPVTGVFSVTGVLPVARVLLVAAAMF